MTLYFYMIDDYDVFKGIKSSECEVIEKAKTYRPVDKFPRGFYGCYVRKDDIGHISGYSGNLVITTEPNFELAKRLFKEKIIREIERLKKSLEKYENKLKDIEESEDK